MFSAIILGTEPRVVVPVARSLARRGVRVVLASRRIDEAATLSTAIARHVRLTANAGGELLTLLSEEGADWIAPTDDTALLLIAQHYDALSARATLACSGPEAIAAVLNKEKTLAVAREVGIEVPISARLPDIATLREADLQFPLIAKPYSKEVQGTFKLRHYNDLAALERDYTADPAFGAKYLLQTFALGEGLGLQMLMHQGEPRLVFCHRRLLENPASGGVSVLAEAITPAPKLVEQSRNLLSTLGWSEGPAMVEYRYDAASGRAVLMEVNGRFWGSLGLSIAAGVDFPGSAWDLAHKRPLAVGNARIGTVARWTPGLLLRAAGMARPEPGDALSRSSVTSALMALPRLLGPSVSDMLADPDDPAPARKELQRTLSELGRKLVGDMIRRVTPVNLRRHLTAWRSLPADARGVYVRRRAERVLGTSTSIPGRVERILVLCHGNIIRSPFAAALLAREGQVVTQAGLRAVAGKPAYPHACRVAARWRVDLTQHSAKPIARDMLDSADLVLVMDGLNEARLLAAYPEAAKKTRLLGAFSGCAEISDPYGGGESDIYATYVEIEKAVAVLCARLPRQEGVTDA